MTPTQPFDDTSLADALSAASARGQERYSATSLASDVSPVVSHIGRQRTVRTAGIGLAFAAAATAIGLTAFAAFPLADPAAPQPTTSTTAPTTPAHGASLQGRPACEAGNFGEASQFRNGEFPEDRLCTLWDGHSQVERVAGRFLWLLNDNYKAEFGEDLCVTSAYLSLDDQSKIAETKEHASLPGTSPHGLGAAIDLCDGQDQGASFAWLSENAVSLGWSNPEWNSAVKSAPWHWEFLPGLGDLFGPVDIPAGATFGDIFRAMVRSQGIGGGPTIDEAEQGVLTELNRQYDGAFGDSIEGWIAPGTYPASDGSGPGFSLTEAAVARYDDLVALGVKPEDMVRVLTIASLVEKEAPRDEDKPLVSGVIANRLAAGKALQLNSTVSFASGIADSLVTTAEQRQSDSPYNTYLHKGLPPGPICSPSAASIQAALHPAAHDFLFFVTVNPDTGETKYASTYDEHLKNVELLHQWLIAHGDGGTD